MLSHSPLFLRLLAAALMVCSVVTGAAGCATAGLPQVAVDHNTEGVLLLESGELDDAEARFRLALEYHPGFSESRANLGLVAFRRGDLEAAEGHLRMAIHQDQDFDEAWSNLGLVLIAMGRDSDAQLAFEAALAVDPGFVNARINLAELLMRHGEFVAARAHLMRLVQIEAEDTAKGAEGSAMLAYCELRLGRTQESLFRAQAVLEVSPDNPLAHLVRGIARAADGALTLAEEDLLAAEADPDLRGDARVRRAAVLILMDRREEAEDILVLLEQAGEARHAQAVALLMSELRAAR